MFSRKADFSQGSSIQIQERAETDQTPGFFIPFSKIKNIKNETRIIRVRQLFLENCTLTRKIKQLSEKKVRFY
jgi:hypothetical protein